MLEILGSVLTGGVTGLLGSAITGVMGYFKQKEINKQTLALKQLDMDMRQMDIEAGKQLAEINRDRELNGKTIEAERDVEVGEIELMKRSMETPDMISGAKIRNNVWFAPFFVMLDILRAGIRPVLTIYLVVLVTWIYGDMQAVMAKLGDGFSADKAEELIQYIVYSILFTTQMVISWWFGSRIKSGMFEQPSLKAKR